MSTATVSLAIVCPDWCVIPASEHADDLWDMGGNCIHRAVITTVDDAAGYCEPLEEPRYHSPLDVTFTSMTSPEGRETASAVLSLNGHETSIEQAEAFARAILAAVGTYRAQVSQ